MNVSDSKFLYQIDRLFMPLNTIYSIGLIQENSIIKERNTNGLFKSFEDFKHRCNFLSQAQIEALVYAGALDIFGKTKRSMIENSSKENDIIFSHLVGVVENKEEYSFEELASNEKKYLGINLQYNIFNNINKLINKYKTIPLSKIQENTYCNSIVALSQIKKLRTKKGDEMATFMVSDGTMEFRGVVFPKFYPNLKQYLLANQLLIVRGRLEKDNRSEYSFNIVDISQVQN